MSRRRAAFAVVAALGSAFALACAGSTDDRPPPAIVIAPANFNQNLPEPIAPGIPVVQEEILSYVKEHGARVVATPPLAEFHDTWIASASHIGTLYDQTGGFDAKRFDAAVAALAQAYAAKLGAFDILVLPYLDVKHVRIRDGNVSWDGVVRRVSLESRDHKTLPDRPYHLIHGLGTPCTSLRVVVYAGGTRLFEAERGLEVMHEYRVAGRLHATLRQDLFQDRGVVRDGVDYVLRRMFRDRP